MAVANQLDKSIIRGDANFAERVMSSLINYITISIPSEGGDAVRHMSRRNFGAQIMLAQQQYKPLFVTAASVNQVLANDATINGTLVGLVSSAISAAITSSVPTSSGVPGVTDTDIDNAVSNAFNSFISGLSS
jgi:hypothetical protein